MQISKSIKLVPLSLVLALYGAVVLADNQISYYQPAVRVNSYQVQQVQNVQPQAQAQIQYQPQQHIAVPVQVMNPQGAYVPQQVPVQVQQVPVAVNVPVHMPTPQLAEDNDNFYQQLYNQ